MIINVERPSSDGLSFEFWRFSDHYFPHMCLVSYGLASRKTKRHKAVIVKKWDTYNERESTLRKPEDIPGDVVDEAYRELLSIISKANLYIGARAEEANILKKGE